ncbi:glycosyltransferase family 2 protein [Microbacterium lushaniae]|uniref:Glycosyltransferase family 2 protein n=1 Tax=Microbacterium lushaniae TaxID=2614639 RepID=A0A5J6L1Z9_9MICO|nr:glycosyltransferase family 2 protein [Microbacterium lushaniae]QEW02477.1 glycosyltransferase family 2 protein [Microbacterium lushaniae]
MTAYAALIIAYRRRDLVKGVLARLAAQSHPPVAVVIVDNGGDLGDVEAPPGLAAPVQVVTRADNPGYGAAVNEARRAVGDAAPALLVLTHDAEFDAELARRLSEALGSAPDIGAAGPVLRRASDPGAIFSAGGRLTRGGRATHVTREPSTRLSDVDWLDGAIVMFRVDALDAIGGVDEEYFLYFEDVDTSWRLARAGWRTVVDRDAHGAQEPGEHPVYLGMRNMALFARRAGIPRIRRSAAAARRLAEVAASALVRGRPAGVSDGWRGWRDGLQGMSGKPAGRGDDRDG